MIYSSQRFGPWGACSLLALVSKVGKKSKEENKNIPKVFAKDHSASLIASPRIREYIAVRVYGKRIRNKEMSFIYSVLILFPSPHAARATASRSSAAYIYT